MYRWVRPKKMPLDEPSEDDIWAAIDSHDPRGNADIRDRLEQHVDMLTGRDIYNAFFTRSPILPECSCEVPTPEDRAKWISTIKVKCAEYNSLDSTVDQVSYGPCDILEPAVDDHESTIQSKILSHRQLQSTSLNWPRDSIIGRLLSPPNGYVVWAQYILQVHKTTLQKAGVYEAIYASMFNYGGILPSWARSTIEFWDRNRNTCWVGSEEATITLWELQAVSGLPIFGRRYEECIPFDEQLFERKPSPDDNRRGKMVLPSVYPNLLSHYCRIHKARGLSKYSRAIIPVDTWISSFLRDDCIFPYAATLSDPFSMGIGFGDNLSDETAEPHFPHGLSSPALSNISEDLSLAGFIVTWLCIFALPMKEDSVRSSALLAASGISRGDRIAIAPAVLARIYRVLGIISELGPVKSQNLTMPWQYIHAWIHLHVRGAFSCIECPSYFLEKGYPTVIQLSQATSTLERERIRLFFFAPQLVIDRFLFVHQPDIVGLPPHLIGVNITDNLDQQGRYSLLYGGRSLRVAEYFFSMRPGWLCYRSSDSVVFEGYQPNRVARQFGFSQVVAYDGRPPIPGIVDVLKTKSVPDETKFYAASKSWLYLLRLGTNSQFYIAAPNSRTGVSYHHLSCVRRSFGPSIEHGTSKYQQQVRALGIPKGLRPRRNIAAATDDRGIHGDDRANMREVDVPSRIRTRTSSPAPTEEPSSSRQRQHSPEVNPHEVLVDHPASLPPQRFLTPEEIPNGLGHSIFDDIYTGIFGFPGEFNSAGFHSDDIDDMREAEMPSRARTRTPSPTPFEAPSPSCRRQHSPEVHPHKVLVDYSASLPPQRFSTPEEISNGQGASIFDEFYTGIFGPVGGFDGHRYQEHVPEVKAHTSTTIYSEEPPMTHWPGESSLISETTHDEDLAMTPYASNALGFPEDNSQNPVEASSEGSEEGEFISKIYCEKSSASDHRFQDQISSGLSFLRETIARVSPGSPDSLACFPSMVNNSLRYLAGLGIEQDDLTQWVSICRDTEFVIAKMKKLTIMKPGGSLLEIRERVRIRREAVDAATDAFGESQQILQQYRVGSSVRKTEIQKITSRLAKLFQKTIDATSSRSRLEAEEFEGNRDMKRQMRRHQLLQQTLIDAEAALTRDSEALRTAEAEYVTLASLMSDLKNIQERLL